MVLGDLSVHGLEETRSIIQSTYPDARIEISKLDVGDEKSVGEFYALAVEKFGRIDFAANVAGCSHVARPSVELTVEDYDRSFQVNLKGVRTSSLRNS